MAAGLGGLAARRGRDARYRWPSLIIEICNVGRLAAGQNLGGPGVQRIDRCGSETRRHLRPRGEIVAGVVVKGSDHLATVGGCVRGRDGMAAVSIAITASSPCCRRRRRRRRCCTSPSSCCPPYHPRRNLLHERGGSRGWVVHDLWSATASRLQDC